MPMPDSRPSSFTTCPRRSLATALATACFTLALPVSAFALIGLPAAPVPSISNVTQIAAAGTFTVFLKSDGTVWESGNFTCTPTQVTGLSNVTQIAAGAAHVVVRKSDGTAWAFGSNSNGQLGNCSTTSSASPVQVRSSCSSVTYLSGVVAVSAGELHSLALISGGTVEAWGYNFYGQLGNGTTTDSDVAVAVSGVTGATAIVAGGYHSLALLANNSGKVKAWGQGADGQLGDGSCVATESTPITMANSSGSVMISAGVDYSLITTASPRAWATGENGNGQLGLGTTTSVCSLTELAKTPIFPAPLVAAGPNAETTVAVRSSDTSLWAWGRNDHGQVGNGTNTNALSPVAVLDGTGTQVTGFSTSSGSVTTSTIFSLALASNGIPWGWGDNVYGSLGCR